MARPRRRADDKVGNETVSCNDRDQRRPGSPATAMPLHRRIMQGQGAYDSVNLLQRQPSFYGLNTRSQNPGPVASGNVKTPPRIRRPRREDLLRQHRKGMTVGPRCARVSTSRGATRGLEVMPLRC